MQQPQTFEDIPGHVLHPPSGPTTISASAERPTSFESPGAPVVEASHAVAQAEHYTPEGKAEHPVLARLGELQQAIKELLEGGQAAGKPMGTSSGVATNPVTQAISAEDAPETVAAIEDAIKYGPKVAAHLAETGRNFAEGMADMGRSLETKAEPLPEGQYVYHATDKGRAADIRKNGVREGSYYWTGKPGEMSKRGGVGVTPVSGNRNDLRYFAVPRTEIEPITAPNEDYHAAQGIASGKYVRSAKAHDAVEVDAEGRPLGGQAPIVHEPTPPRKKSR